MSNIDAVKKYQEKRDSIMLRPSKEEGQKIRDTAKKAGQSVQAYVLQAVHERMEREKAALDRLGVEIGESISLGRFDDRQGSEQTNGSNKAGAGYGILEPEEFDKS